MADTYIEKLNRHQVYLQRVATSLLRDNVYPQLNVAYRAARFELIEYGEINSLTDVNRVNRAITQAMSEALAFEQTNEQLNEIAINEAAYTANLVASTSVAVVTAASETAVTRYVRDAIMTLHSGNRMQSAIWSDFVKAYADKMSERYNAIITNAYSQSLSTGKMATVQQLTKQMRDLNQGIQRHEAESLFRTGVQHYASQANRLMALDNSDIIQREIPIVTFDNRTSDICISINAKYPKGWPAGESPIGYPPYHYQCRTVIGYLVEGQAELDGTRATKGATGGKQIEANTPFAKWLRGQPKSFVVETLGNRRADLFLSGKLPLANLTDRFLNPLTIDELKLKD